MTIIKKSIIAAAVSIVVPFSASSNVLITEYVEGSSNNKVIELSNLGNETVDLSADNYRLGLYNNGSSNESRGLALSGSLAPRQSLIIYNPSASSAFAPTDGIASQVAYFNGDDALVLTRNGSVIDSLGRVGNDPGSAWTDGSGFSTKDKTIRRLPTVTQGDTNISDSFPGSNNEWVTFPKDTSDGLSCAGITACPTNENSVLITEYVEGSGNNKAVEISNLGTANIDLAAEGYRLEAFNNGSTQATNGVNLTGILVPNSSIVVYNANADAEFVKAAPQGIASSVANFNGDDALVLTKDSVVIDSFGRQGEDPGSAWRDDNNSSFTTSNATLRRLASINAGDVVVDDAFPGQVNEWVRFSNNTADGLGCIGESACTGSEPLPVTEIDDGNNCGGDNGGGTDPGTGTGTELCVNCPDITKVKDASSFVDADYYAAALNASSSQLRSVLNTIISADHKQLSYSEIWSVLTYSDQDPNNTDNVVLLYSGKSIPKMSNGSGSQSSNPDNWNREHIWAKSHGFPSSSQLAYTDAHHLRPADISINATRSNFDFDNGGNMLPESPQNSYDSSLRTWEPRDEVKGDVARMMFYMDVRYAGATADGTPDLVLVDNIGTENGTPYFGKLCTLYQWSLVDVVDAAEQQRNDAVYEYQGNRNPFIDHPEWVETIFGPMCSGN